MQGQSSFQLDFSHIGIEKHKAKHPCIQQDQKDGNPHLSHAMVVEKDVQKCQHRNNNENS